MSQTNEQVIEDLDNPLTTETETTLLDSDGKNSMSLLCLNCNCLLLRPNIAIFVKIEVNID